jgi:hypothetical protein
VILNALRFLGSGDSTWQGFRLGAGTGRFRNYQCLAADPATLRAAVQAVTYALTGAKPGAPDIAEAALQLGDDAGHAWIVHRRPGLLRVLRNGEPVEAEQAERVLNAALLDLDPHAAAARGAPALGRQRIVGRGEELRLAPLDEGKDDPAERLRELVTGQIEELAASTARGLGLPAATGAPTLLRLAKGLEPLAARLHELNAQQRQIAAEGDGDGELAAIQRLAAELQLIDAVEQTAAPLLKPGVSLKAMRDEEKAVEAEIAALCKTCGVQNLESLTQPRDYAKPVEALARLEAYAKLIRASHGARKYCEQSIEPHYKQYLEVIETNLAGDRRISSELESCLATLTLRMRISSARRAVHHETAGGAPQPGHASPAGLKTWFERFKQRGGDIPAPDERGPAVDAEDGDDTTRMALEYALARLGELGEGVGAARSAFESAMHKIDQAHEELLRSYARLKENWTSVAKASGLPEELTLAQLMALVTNQARLTTLGELRTELAARVRRYGADVAKLEQLVVEWRKATGSQKLADLSNLSILLQEARDVLRYREPRAKRLEQLRAKAAEARAKQALAAHVEARRQALLAEWAKAAAAGEAAGIEPTHAGLADLFRNASALRGLALVHAATVRPTPAKLFDAATEHLAASLYLWDDARTDNPTRLALLKQLETGAGGELRLLLIADEGLAAMLGTLGVGLATRIPGKPEPLPPRAPAPQPTLTTPPPSRPVVRSQPSSRPPQSLSLLNERAQQALQILNGRKP